MRNFLDEETLEDEYKKAMTAFFGKKGNKSESSSPEVGPTKLRIGRQNLGQESVS